MQTGRNGVTTTTDADERLNWILNRIGSGGINYALLNQDEVRGQVTISEDPAKRHREYSGGTSEDGTWEEPVNNDAGD